MQWMISLHQWKYHNYLLHTQEYILISPMFFEELIYLFMKAPKLEQTLFIF